MKQEWRNPSLANMVGCILIGYFLLMIPLRYYAQGPSAMFELLWACNIALLICGFGCVFKSAALIGSGIALISFPHLSWNFDLIAYFLTGSFPLGVSSYILWPTTHPMIIATTLHHIWQLPLCFAVLKANGGLPFKLMLYSVFYVFVLAAICRFITPIAYDGVYINVNMAHEWWKDAPGDFFHQFDRSPAYIYLPWAALLANVFNILAFVFWKFLFDVIINRDYIQVEVLKKNKIRIN